MCQNDTPHRFGSAPRFPDRRAAARHAHTERVKLAMQWGTLAGSLMDISTSGAQVRLAEGLVPIEGDSVMLRLVDGRHLAGSVARIGRDSIGIGFDRPLGSIADLVWLEQRGPDWFYASVRAQSRVR